MPSSIIGCAAGNFLRGRPAGFAPEAVVLHRTGGTRESWRGKFNNPATSMSAHYVIGRDGHVDQYLLEEDTAFHAGRVSGASWRRLKPNVNPNFYTIGIELEGGHADTWPDAQVAATANLLAGISTRWQIELDTDHVVPHSAIRPSSGCPADTCPIARIVETARARIATAVVSRQEIVRTLARANLRQGAPSVRAPIARVIPPDTEIVVSGFTQSGDRVQGNSSWYADGDGRFFWAGATDVPNPTADSGFTLLRTTETANTDSMELPVLLPSGSALNLGVTVDRTTMVLPAAEFVEQETLKDLIVLHFTAGRTARSAFDTWRNDPRRIGTSYIVDVDGTIYEVFSPVFWASHLGIPNSQSAHDRRSIGIEIANVGPLQPSADDPRVLNWWLPKAKGARDFTTRFCGLDETDKYIEADFRTKKHFAAFKDQQVDAVGALVRGLCSQFSIPPTLPVIPRRFQCDAAGFSSYKGVCTHANFRLDKWDIGPAFAWDRLGL